MFSQALSQLPAHTKKILHESEGDKARLRTEYAGAPVPLDSHYPPTTLSNRSYSSNSRTRRCSS